MIGESSNGSADAVLICEVTLSSKLICKSTREIAPSPSFDAQYSFCRASLSICADSDKDMTEKRLSLTEDALGPNSA